MLLGTDFDSKSLMTVPGYPLYFTLVFEHTLSQLLAPGTMPAPC